MLPYGSTGIALMISGILKRNTILNLFLFVCLFVLQIKIHVPVTLIFLVKHYTTFCIFTFTMLIIFYLLKRLKHFYIYVFIFYMKNRITFSTRYVMFKRLKDRER